MNTRRYTPDEVQALVQALPTHAATCRLCTEALATAGPRQAKIAGLRLLFLSLRATIEAAVVPLPAAIKGELDGLDNALKGECFYEDRGRTRRVAIYPACK
jgi:hypothetical protein